MLLFVSSPAAVCRRLRDGVLKRGAGVPHLSHHSCAPRKPLLGVLQCKSKETLLNAKKNQKKTHHILSDILYTQVVMMPLHYLELNLF